MRQPQSYWRSLVNAAAIILNNPMYVFGSADPPVDPPQTNYQARANGDENTPDSTYVNIPGTTPIQAQSLADADAEISNPPHASNAGATRMRQPQSLATAAAKILNNPMYALSSGATRMRQPQSLANAAAKILNNPMYALSSADPPKNQPQNNYQAHANGDENTPDATYVNIPDSEYTSGSGGRRGVCSFIRSHRSCLTAGIAVLLSLVSVSLAPLTFINIKLDQDDIRQLYLAVNDLKRDQDTLKCDQDDMRQLATTVDALKRDLDNERNQTAILEQRLHEMRGIRLVGGNSSNEGRVEVFFNKQWGTVCDDYWEQNDAHVVCRQLGYPSATAAPWLAYFGPGSGPIWLDDVACGGSERTIFDCGHSEWGAHGCGHLQDAGVSVDEYPCWGNETARRVQTAQTLFVSTVQMYKQAQPVRSPVVGPGNSQTSGPQAQAPSVHQSGLHGRARHGIAADHKRQKGLETSSDTYEDAETVNLSPSFREARLQRAGLRGEPPLEGADGRNIRRYANLPDAMDTSTDRTYPSETNGRRCLRDFVRHYRGCILGTTAVVATLVILGLVVTAFHVKKKAAPKVPVRSARSGRVRTGILGSPTVPRAEPIILPLAVTARRRTSGLLPRYKPPPPLPGVLGYKMKIERHRSDFRTLAVKDLTHGGTSWTHQTEDSSGKASYGPRQLAHRKAAGCLVRGTLVQPPMVQGGSPIRHPGDAPQRWHPSARRYDENMKILPS
ncbi:hypothetical protein Bbelb_319770 [Branchiostoma belcheri]|nr:hypothetical protein Bbelb_319770 [Branchiostoma belcheri]